MKLGVVGKGGVGKTTLAALFAAAYARRGARVVAVDTDSNPNLGISLGLTPSETDAVPVLPRGLVVGSDNGTGASQLLAEFGRSTPSGPTLLSAIRVTDAAAGCMCAGHATVRSLLDDALADQADVVVVDMEAGLEHLSRSGGTLAYADVLVVVMDPSRKSLITAARTAALADELGIRRVFGVGNKARPGDDEFFRRGAEEHALALAGVVPHDPAVAGADRAGVGVAADPPRTVRDAVDGALAFVDGAAAG